MPSVGNNSFETPSVSGDFESGVTIGSGATPWSFDPSSCSGITDNAGSTVSPVAPTSFGTQQAYIVYQITPTAVFGYVEQTLTFLAGIYTVTLNACRENFSQKIDIQIDGTVIGTITPTGSYATYTSPSFTVTAGSHVMKLICNNAAVNQHVFIDEVIINTVSTTPTVDPNSYYNSIIEDNAEHYFRMNQID